MTAETPSTTGEHAVCSNPVCALRLERLEKAVNALEEGDEVTKLREMLQQFREELAGLKGQLRGYLFAGGLVGTAVGALVAVVASMLTK